MGQLDEKEQEELKTLQEERKSQHMSDSNRVRLSELLKKGEPEGKEAKTAAPSAAPAGKK